MKLRVIKQTRLNGEDVHPGEIVDLDKDLAEAWERARIADKISVPEAAKIIPPETAVLKSPRGRKPGSGKEKI